ncbi:MAG: hypothetical protein SNJ78_09775 [Spirochaetales bacterium]
MEGITNRRKAELLLLYTKATTLLYTGLVVAAGGLVGVGVLTFVLFPKLALSIRLLAVAILFCVTASIGILLRSEIVLSQKYRYPGAVPLYYSLQFLSWLITGFLILFGQPAAFSGVLSQYLILPFLLVFVVALGYIGLTKTVYFTLLNRLSHPDYISLHYRDQIWENLRPIWETVRRYKDPCILSFIRLSFPNPSISPEETLKQIEEADQVVKSQLRLTDRNGIRGKDTLYVLLPNTEPDVSDIPLKRIKSALINRGFPVSGMVSVDLRSITGSPKEVLDQIEAQLSTSG